MSTTSPPQDRVHARPATGGIPAQRVAPPEHGMPPVIAPEPGGMTLSPQAVRALRKATLLAQAAPITDTSTTALPVAPIPTEALPVVAAPPTEALPLTAVPPTEALPTVALPTQARPAVVPPHAAPVVVRPVRTMPARPAPALDESSRVRWPSVVGGLAAGLTFGLVGAFGAVLALTALATPTTPTSTALAATPASVSPNVSVPGRVRTSFGDGTWQVGVDIAPGRYVTTGALDGRSCRHAVRTARTGGTETAAGAGPGVATVVLTADAGWFTTSGCATWTRVA